MEERLIYKINDNLEIVETYKNVKEISISEKEKRANFDQALRKKIKAKGFYYIFKHEWDLGVRPDPNKQIRYQNIYAYLPSEKITPLLKEGDFSEDIKEYKFIGKFADAVEAAIYLEISVSNIRNVAQRKILDKFLVKKPLLLHRGYYFSYTPLSIEELDFKFTIPTQEQRKLYIGFRPGKSTKRNF